PLSGCEARTRAGQARTHGEAAVRFARAARASETAGEHRAAHALSDLALPACAGGGLCRPAARSPPPAARAGHMEGGCAQVASGPDMDLAGRRVRRSGSRDQRALDSDAADRRADLPALGAAPGPRESRSAHRGRTRAPEI